MLVDGYERNYAAIGAVEAGCGSTPLGFPVAGADVGAGPALPPALTEITDGGPAVGRSGGRGDLLAVSGNTPKS